MEWPILALLVPLVLTLLLFLARFAGCSAQLYDPTPPPDPSDFTAEPLGPNIRLTWNDNGANTTHFKIRRSRVGADPPEIVFIENIQATPGTPPVANVFTNSLGLMPATTYEYRLFAVAVNLESTGVILAQATTLP